MVKALGVVLALVLLTALAAASVAAPAAGRIMFFRYAANASGVVLYSVNADGSDLRQLAAAPRGAALFGDARWSPDGKRLALGYWRGSGAGLYVARADGSSPQRLAPGTVVSFSWSPDGGRIVFEKVGPDCGNQVYVVSSRGGPARLLARASAGCGDARKPVWSPDGRTIAFVRRPSGRQVGRQGDLWVVHPDGTRGRKLATGDIIHPPSWSADSNWIGYSSFKSTASLNGYYVFLVRRDGTARTQLTPMNDVDEGPLWAPAGKAIAYTAFVPGVTSDGTHYDEQILVQRTMTSPRESFLDEGGGADLVWSPDATRIAAITSDNSGNSAMSVATLGQPDFTQIVSGDAYPLDWK